MKQTAIFLIFIYLFLFDSYGQQYKPGIPLTFQDKYLSLFNEILSGLKSNEESKIVLPYIDNKAVSEEADEFAFQSGYSSGKFYGKVLNVAFDLKSQARHVTIDNGNLSLNCTTCRE